MDDAIVLSRDEYAWLRCSGCGFETTEDRAEVCERCGKTYCTVCWRNGKGYIDMEGEFWGPANGTGYVCEKCVPVHIIDTECPTSAGSSKKR